MRSFTYRSHTIPHILHISEFAFMNQDTLNNRGKMMDDSWIVIALNRLVTCNRNVAQLGRHYIPIYYCATTKLLLHGRRSC